MARMPWRDSCSREALRPAGQLGRRCNCEKENVNKGVQAGPIKLQIIRANVTKHRLLKPPVQAVKT